MKFLAGVGLLLLFFSCNVTQVHACTLEVTINGTIGPATFDLLKRAQSKVSESSCSSLLLLIDTPGGSLGEARKIVSLVLDSPHPVLCLVAPEGGRAGSAGALIQQSCHYTGALPNTTIGAATPILSFGQDLESDLKNKVIADMVSWSEQLAERYGRNKKVVREFITEAKVISGQEALSLNVIESFSESKREFLEGAFDREILLKQGEIAKISIGNLVEYKRDLRFWILDLLTDPQWAYLIFLASLALIYFEITHPGTFLPGIFGSMGLIVSLITFEKLDVQWAGVSLIVLGFLLFLLEVFIPSFGILGVGGIVALFLGSVFLYDPVMTQGGVPLPLIFGVVTALSLVLFGIVYLLWSTKKLQGQASHELVGKSAKIERRISAIRYQVSIEGELWRYESEQELEPGDQVVIKSVKGLTLY